ncbi:MAG: HAMP domain-containing histidine kinase [Oscillospiraceae bacterium]|nr:HAMP domain-containing histidine kinase [Oscillospiraceae bacterium]
MFKFINGMKFRLWLLFIGFTTIILGILYFNQIILLPNYYNFIKTQETTGVANILKTNWNNYDLISEMNRLSREHEMRIDIDRYIGGVRVSESSAENSITISNMFTIDGDEVEALKRQASSGRNRTVTSNRDGLLYYVTYIGPGSSPEGYIAIFTYLQPLGNTQDVLQSQFFLMSCVVYLLAVALSAFVVTNITSPLTNISDSAGKLVTGEFVLKTSKGDYTEIITLTENLNIASREIAKTENFRKDLLANVSHDLKTPLTMIKAYAEMIRDLSGNHPQKRENHLKVIIDEADRLNSLVVDLLDLSKIQSGVATKNVTTFDFSEHLGAVIGRFDYLSVEHGIKIISEIEKGIIVKADLSKIEQVVYNFVNNAINHAGKDKKVTVQLYRKKEGVARFEVKDKGSGIAKEELPYIWERYYKATKSRFHKRTTIGTGLGLSIVKGVMDMHGFAYGVVSAPGKGSTFWFEFPCE